MIVEMDNGVSLDYHDFYEPAGEILSQHYAFLVSEEAFDEVFDQIKTAGQEYWAYAGLRASGEINHNDGGRGVYCQDPDGHVLELITRPYGSGAATP
jgi:catechol 2,3-dioxygenase-like lactoylglutathione lyase family enzyme